MILCFRSLPARKRQAQFKHLKVTQVYTPFSWHTRTIVFRSNRLIRLISGKARPLHHLVERCGSLHRHPTTNIVFLCRTFAKHLPRSSARQCIDLCVIDLLTSSSSVHFNRAPPNLGVRSPDAVMYPLPWRIGSSLLSAVSKGNGVTASPSKLNFA